MRASRSWIVSAAVVLLLSGPAAGQERKPHPPNLEPRAADQIPLGKVKLPPGFKIDLWATGLANARSMTLGDKGTLFVGTRFAGNVYAVVDRGATREVKVIAKGLHRFGPDGQLYVPIGGPCNICEPDRERYAMITRMKPDGSAREIFARGVRNTVGFDWHPETRELWFTDNGRDLLGDDTPPDELNHAVRAGMDFGFPYCHAGELPDPEFGARRPCTDFTPPAMKLAPHVAALGMRFYTGSMFPAEYRHRIFIAQHGAWDRRPLHGFNVLAVTLEGGKAAKAEPFAEGWLEDGARFWGRPVDVQVMPDGALLVSDDYTGAIYRISYSR